MHALAVLGELVGGDLVLRHVGRVGVAAGAGLGQAQRMDGREGVLDGADVVHAVAVDAGGAASSPSAMRLPWTLV